MPSYHQCDGTVTNIAGGLRCSTGWVTYTPPTTQTNTLELTGELITYEQANGLMSSFLTLMAIYAVFKIMYRILS